MQHEGQKQIVDICTRDLLLLHGFQDGLQAAWVMADGLPQLHGFCVLQGKRASPGLFSARKVTVAIPHQAQQELSQGPEESEHTVASTGQRKGQGVMVGRVKAGSLPTGSSRSGRSKWPCLE